MTVADPRYQPQVEVDQDHLREMVAPIAGGAVLREFELLEGGLVNTVYRVQLAPGGTTMALRVYPEGSADAIHSECRILSELNDDLPVSHVLFADPDGRVCGQPYLIYRWVDGITLNEYRRGALPSELARLAHPLGRLTARISAHPSTIGRAPRPVATELEAALIRLHVGLARERLGAQIADLLAGLLEENAELLGSCESDGLVHGDYGGRNLLIAPDPEGWHVSAVLDWDAAASGSALWDVGSFFRYSRRYDAVFTDGFAEGYRAAGGELPDDWWLTARLLDATRVVGILDEPRPLPRIFAECGLLVAALLEDRGLVD
jgi:aminoglycoside phosphotransferase (APT) family kinase protein